MGSVYDMFGQGVWSEDYVFARAGDWLRNYRRKTNHVEQGIACAVKAWISDRRVGDGSVNGMIQGPHLCLLSTCTLDNRRRDARPRSDIVS